MSIKRSFVEQDMLTKRKRLGWLGWVTIIVTASFLVALGIWVWRTMTQEPTPYEKSPTVSNGQDDAADTAALYRLTITPQPSPTTNPARGETTTPWVVFRSKDPLGQEIWDAPAEIKAAVVKDYLDAMAWTDSLMFDPDTLDARLGDYYDEKRLAEMRAILAWARKENKVVAISGVKRLPQGTVVSTFSPDGLTARVLDYHAAGEGQLFDLKTRKPIPGAAYPNSMHMVEMTYDTNARRWKIAHELMIYDLEANQILWREEWDSAE
ncbi:MAG: hypothetical protein IT331_13485 [Anaerolineae bacterium]|nr:hypothetical protein [Anaerolineae bacterium]